jgi:hypothetical protein
MQTSSRRQKSHDLVHSPLYIAAQNGHAFVTEQEARCNIYVRRMDRGGREKKFELKKKKLTVRDF